MKIILPWLLNDLSPNARCHWTKKGKATKLYRNAARRLAELEPVPNFNSGDISLIVTFNPPDNRRRDRTNMEASFKAGFDGLADAWGVNDFRFSPTYRKGEAVKGGSVTVEVLPC